MKKTIQISGMKCEHCVARVEKALNDLNELKQVKVNLAKNQATVQGVVSDDVLIKAIQEAGYQVTSITEKKGLFEK
ncbi:MAG: cation transporter [Prevotella sp.]|nr:cation transporter [Staphylococcus sp.]MCM1349798.1 cation transporter [Prevotella sp.]